MIEKGRKRRRRRIYLILYLNKRFYIPMWVLYECSEQKNILIFFFYNIAQSTKKDILVPIDLGYIQREEIYVNKHADKTL
ncbi:MAG TPA: hypothetical protein VN703_03105 [Candidatus Sulfopaludibacter sp.]|nr:hypothetical protein [Candidatus Sulfopaludibacter sp.]